MRWSTSEKTDSCLERELSSACPLEAWDRLLNTTNSMQQTEINKKTTRDLSMSSGPRNPLPQPLCRVYGSILDADLKIERVGTAADHVAQR